MKEKSTDELEKALGSTHPNEASDFLKKNEDSLLSEEYAFANYMRKIFKEKNISQQEIF